MIIKRNLQNLIQQTGKHYQAIFITGPRQSGKTTLAKISFPAYTYTNLENPETRMVAKTDPQTFLQQSTSMIVDEIQRAPELLSYIQTIVDQNRQRKYIITGSQNILISHKISQTLAGRVAIFNLLPFSLQELKGTKYESRKAQSQIIKGFYPRLYDRNLNPEEWYANYIQTYLERDVRDIKNITNLTDFQRFLKICAGRTAQILNISSLAGDVGVSVNTIKGWLAILEATFVIHLLPPYYNNFSKRIIKAPKLFFYDTGVVCSLLGIKNSAQLQYHPLFGSIFETMCVSELLKQNFNNNFHLDLYYWRDKVGNEIDVMYEKNSVLTVVEIKSSATIASDHLKNLNYFEKVAHRKINKEIIYAAKNIDKYKGVTIEDWQSLKI